MKDLTTLDRIIGKKMISWNSAPLNADGSGIRAFTIEFDGGAKVTFATHQIDMADDKGAVEWISSDVVVLRRQM